MKCSALNVDLNDIRFDPLGSRSPWYACIKFGRYCWARISYGDSVCLSICPSWPRTESSPSEIDSVFTPYDSIESLVSNEVIWCRWVRRFPSNEGIKEGYPLRNCNFTSTGSSSVKTVADRHRLAAYHNKHYWRAFQWYQHRWPWTTLNPINMGF